MQDGQVMPEMSLKRPCGDHQLNYLHSSGGNWVARSVKCPAPDFSTGHDLKVVGSSPT